MCFKSPKPLNPRAKEWVPPHHHLVAAHAPPQAPATTPAQLPHKLPWHIPFYHPFPSHFVPLSWSHTVYYHARSTFPATRRSNEAAPPIHDGEIKCVTQAERPIVSFRKGASRVSGMRSNAPPPRRQWKPRMIQTDGAGGAASPPGAPLLEKVPSSVKRTTVMIRNIPNQLRRDFMLEFLDGYCSEYSLEYDFMYLPMDFMKGDNLGYAFVNFTTEEGAMKLKEILRNYKWGNVITEKGVVYASKKICVVTWARIQGKDRLVKRFEGSTFACNNTSFLPVVFEPPRGQGGAATTPVTVGSVKSN